MCCVAATDLARPRPSLHLAKAHRDLGFVIQLDSLVKTSSIIEFNGLSGSLVGPMLVVIWSQDDVRFRDGHGRWWRADRRRAPAGRRSPMVKTSCSCKTLSRSPDPTASTLVSVSVSDFFFKKKFAVLVALPSTTRHGLWQQVASAVRFLHHHGVCRSGECFFGRKH